MLNSQPSQLQESLACLLFSRALQTKDVEESLYFTGVRETKLYATSMLSVRLKQVKKRDHVEKQKPR